MLTGSEYLKDALTEHQHYEKMNPFMIDSFIQTGLILSEGDRWKRQRMFLGQAFTFEKLKSRIQMMNQVVKEIVDKDPTEEAQIFQIMEFSDLYFDYFLLSGIKLINLEKLVRWLQNEFK